MRAAVIGGGITGCFTALELIERGFQVTIFEATHKLGGVLRDVTVGEKVFFNNCQYLDFRSFNKFDLEADLYEFPHYYGSFTNLQGGDKRLVFDCAQPCLGGKFQGFDESRLRIHASAFERLRAYGPKGDLLISWAKGFGDLQQLDYRCLTPMQLSRVFYSDDKEIGQKKYSNERYNEILAIPRRLWSPPKETESAWLPRHGFDTLFDGFESQLRARGCSIRFKSPVKVSKAEADRVTLSFKSDIGSFDLAVWASNPTQVLLSLVGLQLSTPPVKMTLVVGEFEFTGNSSREAPIYWQFFDIETKLVRLYIYHLQGKKRFSAEFFGRSRDGELYESVSKALNILGIFTSFKIYGVFRQSRFVNFSTHEYNTVSASEELLLSNRILPGAWFTYGREGKMNEIRGLLDKAMDSCKGVNAS